MTINKFIKICSKKDTPLGKFANDIISEEDFPFIESNEQVFEILETKAARLGLIKLLDEFKTAFKDAQ